MANDSTRTAIGIMGGTFNPVHFGHLRCAVEFAEAFDLSAVSLMPCYQPVHREEPSTAAEHRVNMLALAIEESAKLELENIEIERGGPSYAVDSLLSLRERYGHHAELYFAMGIDAFNQFTGWKNWQGILTLVNIVIMRRPDEQLIISHDELKQRLTDFNAANTRPTAGNIYSLATTELAISSTQIRKLIAQQQSIDFLLPNAVQQYIKQQHLYQSA